MSTPDVGRSGAALRPAHGTNCETDAVATVGLEWTVLTWNLQGSKRTALDRVAEILSSSGAGGGSGAGAGAGADVIVLQEVRQPQAADLARTLEMRHIWNEKHNPYHPFLSGRVEGAAILTPHGLADPGHEQVSAESSMRSYRRRIVQWARVERSDASAYRVFNAHLSPHDLVGERRSEAERIAALAAAGGDSPPALIVGDLNDDDPDLVAILPGTDVADSPPTNPSGRPTQRLDHVLVPPGATVVSVSAPAGGTDWAQLSDHLPLTVRFALDWVHGDFTA